MLTDYHVHLRPDDDGTPRRASTSRPRTRSATARRRPSAASRSWGSSEHIHRFTAALDVWTHPWWQRNANDDIDEYCAFVRERDRPAAGHRGRLRARPRGPDGGPAGRAGVGLRGRLGALPPATRPWTCAAASGTSGARATPTRCGRATSRRSARPPAPACSTSSPTPTWSRSGARGRPRPEGDLRRFYELAMDGIAGSDVAIEVSTAGLRKPVGEIYPDVEFLRDVPGGGQAGRAVQRRPRARGPGPWLRPGGRLAARAGRDRAGGVRGRRAATGAAGDERPHRHRLRLAPPGRGAAAGPRRCRGARGRRAG